MVTQLTCPFQDHALLLRGKLHLVPLSQPPIPPLTPALRVVGGILGLVALAETSPVQGTRKIQVAQWLSAVVGTGSEMGERRRRRVGLAAPSGSSLQLALFKLLRQLQGSLLQRVGRSPPSTWEGFCATNLSQSDRRLGCLKALKCSAVYIVSLGCHRGTA